MAKITIDIPDNRVGQLLDDFASQYGYEEMIPDGTAEGTMIPNPMNKAAFARSIIVKHIRNVYHKARVAEIDAAKANIEDVDITAS